MFPNTLRAVIAFQKQSVQMVFSPKHALDDFHRKVKEVWNIPKKDYYLLVNGNHEDIPTESWPVLSSIRVIIKGPIGGEKQQKPRIKVHLKIDGTPHVYVLEIREDAILEDVNDMITDVLGNVARAGLYQENAILDIADSVKEWMTVTGSKSEIALKPDVNFKGDEIFEQIPVMETVYDGVSHWVRNTPYWKKITEDHHEIRFDAWKLNKPSQDWEEGTYEIVVEDETSSEEEEHEELSPLSPTVEPPTVTLSPPEPPEETLTSEEHKQTHTSLPCSPTGNETSTPEEHSSTTQPSESSAGNLNITIQLRGEDFQISCSSNEEMWSQLKRRAIVRGALYLTTDDGETVVFGDLINNGHYRARYVNPKVYDRIAKDEYEKCKTDIYVEWEGKREKFRFISNWDFWQELKSFTGLSCFFKCQYEDGSPTDGWIQDGVYHLLPDGRLISPNPAPGNQNWKHRPGIQTSLNSQESEHPRNSPPSDRRKRNQVG
jgi:hypothetical protein